MVPKKKKTRGPVPETFKRLFVAPKKNMLSSLLRPSGDFKLFYKNAILNTMAHCNVSGPELLRFSRRVVEDPPFGNQRGHSFQEIRENPWIIHG